MPCAGHDQAAQTLAAPPPPPPPPPFGKAASEEAVRPKAQEMKVWVADRLLVSYRLIWMRSTMSCYRLQRDSSPGRQHPQLQL